MRRLSCRAARACKVDADKFCNVTWFFGTLLNLIHLHTWRVARLKAAFESPELDTLSME